MVSTVLTNKNFVYLWVAQILTQTSFNMLNYLLVIKVWENTQSNSAISLVILSFTLPAILFGPVAGVLVDRWDTKKALVLTNLLRAVLILPFLLVLHNPFTVLPLIFVISTVTQFFIPAEGSAIPALVKKEHLLSANSLFTLTINVSLVLGFVLSGPVVRVLGAQGLIVFVLICFLAASFLVSQLPHISGSSGGEGLLTILKELGHALKFIWKKPVLRKAVFAITSVNAFILTLSSLGPGYVGSVLQIDVVDAGLILVAPGVLGIVAGSILLSARGKNWDEEMLIDLGFVSAGLILPLLTFFTPEFFGSFASVMAMFAMFVLGVFGSLVNAPATTILHKNTPEELRGRIYGVVNTMISGVSATPLLVAGGLADVAGVGNVIFSFGVILLTLGVYRAKRIISYFR